MLWKWTNHTGTVSKKWYKEMKEKREDEKEKEKHKIFEETIESFGIKQTVVEKIKSSLETSIMYKELVQVRYSYSQIGDQHLQIRDADKFL